MFSFLQRWFPREDAGAAGNGTADLATRVRELASDDTPHMRKLEHAAALYPLAGAPEFKRYVESARGADLQLLGKEAELGRGRGLSLGSYQTSFNEKQVSRVIDHYTILCLDILTDALGGASKPVDEPTFIAYAALKGPQTDGDIQSFMDSVWETNHHDIGARYKVLVSLGSRIADKANHSGYKAVIGAKSQILIDQIANATETAVLTFISQERAVPNDQMPNISFGGEIWNIDRLNQLRNQYGLEPYYGREKDQGSTYLDRLAAHIGDRLIKLESVRSRLDSEGDDPGRRLITERKHLYDDHLFPVLGSGIFGRVIDYLHEHKE